MRFGKQLGMGIHRLIAAGLLMAALGAPSPAPAQEATAPPPAPVEGPRDPDSLPRGGATLEKHIESLRRGFTQLDADFDGVITQRDVDVHVLMETVLQRAYAWVFVLRYDLDGDGAVTKDEILRSLRYEVRSNPIAPQKYIDDRVRSIMELDTDKDGKVSIAEAREFRDPQLQRSMELDSPSERTHKVLTLESGTKGEITLKDYEAAGVALFRKVDADNDGKISQAELDAYRKSR